MQWTTDYLKGHGSESPRLDAEVLLAEALGCQRIELYTTFDDVPGDDAADGVPRAGPPPGRRHAGGLSGRPPRVLLALVPRHARRADPPAGDRVAGRGGARSGEEEDGPSREQRAGSEALRQPDSIADVGTGSGIIAVCLAKHLPSCRVTAIDISPAALAVAQENAKQHGVADRIEFVESDLFAAVPADRQFDFVVSNPPYVTAAEMDKLAADVRKFEPRARCWPVRGTEVIERLIPQAAERLRPGGHLLMEISPTIHDAVLCALRPTAVSSLARRSRTSPAAARGAGEEEGLGISTSRRNSGKDPAIQSLRCVLVAQIDAVRLVSSPTG